jgi:rhodanese-related sulfurtransferase
MIIQIRPSELAQWLESMRAHGEPHELQIASIRADGFELLTIPMGVIPPRLAELNPEQPIACLCHHGARSMQVAYFLEGRGFNHVANIAGGINAWSAELDPTIARY